MSQRKAPNDKLERLYSKNVRCPYCRMMIPKYVVICEQCGVTKEQIAQASNRDAKEIIKGRGTGKVVMTKTRPDDIDFVKLILITMFFGMFGGHCFYVGRRIRGMIMLGSMLLFILSAIIFPMGTPANMMQDMSPTRRIFVDAGFWFPMDVPGLLVLALWFADWFAIVVFNSFRYPVRLANIEKNTKKQKKRKR